MLACVLLQLGLGLYQNWMIQRGGGALDLQSRFMVLGIMRLLINCFFMGGVVMLAFALSRALRPHRAGPPPLA
jgi:high-affinity Fe2+/Pb2+ permease